MIPNVCGGFWSKRHWLAALGQRFTGVFPDEPFLGLFKDERSTGTVP